MVDSKWLFCYTGFISIKRRKVLDMSKSTKQTDAPKSTKKTDVKGKAAGLYSLAVALTELAATYVFVTQDNKILLPLAVVLGVDCAQRFARAFLRAV